MNETDTLALYVWNAGDCFRCAQGGVDTTLLHEMTPPSGVSYEIRACRLCVLALEADVRRAAERAGGTYIPGRLVS